MQEGKQGFIGVWIPKDVLMSENLTPAEKIIFANIASFEKCCFESNERLAKKCGVDERTISRALRNLSDLGFIVIELVNNNSSRRRIYAIMDNPKKLNYLMKKGLFPQAKEEKNRDEIKSFPQGRQNVDPQQLKKGEGRQNGEEGRQNVDPQNRGEGRQNVYHRINKKKEEKAETYKNDIKVHAPAHAPFDGRMTGSFTGQRRPSRRDFPDDESFEKAFYAWNTYKPE